MMRNLRFPISRRPRGVALITGLLISILILLVALIFLGISMTESNISSNAVNTTKAFYAAEGGLESGFVSLRGLLVNAQPTSSQLAAIASPTLTDPSLAGFSLALNAAQPGPAYNTIIDRGASKGLRATVTDYEVTSTADGPKGVRVVLAQAVRYFQIPLFQFGVFYGKGVDFEAYAGPAMTFNGRIHANSDIYIADDGNSTTDLLYVNSYVTAAGNVYRRRKDQDQATLSDRYNNTRIKDGSGNYQILDFDREVKSISEGGNSWAAGSLDYWKTTALQRFNGKLLDSAHGVQEITPPVPELFYNPSNPDVIAHQMIEPGLAGDSAALQNSKLYYKADLRIVDGVARDKNGNVVNLASCASGSGDPLKVKTFYDKRENKTVTARELSIAKLQACGKMPSNGILYIGESGASAADKSVRIAEGATLNNDLTIVSENHVYVQGDYNKNSPKAAAILGDAVSILSNAWAANGYDAKGMNLSADRPASATEVNAAIATGPAYESSPGEGNGEFNNLMRFLENWEGVTLKYRGSLVALWHSQQAKGKWRAKAKDDPDGYYVPPVRDWAYDTMFDTKQPPGMLSGIQIVKGPWVKK